MPDTLTSSPENRRCTLTSRRPSVDAATPVIAPAATGSASKITIAPGPSAIVPYIFRSCSIADERRGGFKKFQWSPGFSRLHRTRAHRCRAPVSRLMCCSTLLAGSSFVKPSPFRGTFYVFRFLGIYFRRLCALVFCEQGRRPMAPRRGCWEGHRFFSSARSSLLWS